MLSPNAHLIKAENTTFIDDVRKRIEDAGLRHEGQTGEEQDSEDWMLDEKTGESHTEVTQFTN